MIETPIDRVQQDETARGKYVHNRHLLYTSNTFFLFFFVFTKDPHKLCVCVRVCEQPFRACSFAPLFSLVNTTVEKLLFTAQKDA